MEKTNSRTKFTLALLIGIYYKLLHLLSRSIEIPMSIKH